MRKWINLESDGLIGVAIIAINGAVTRSLRRDPAKLNRPHGWIATESGSRSGYPNPIPPAHLFCSDPICYIYAMLFLVLSDWPFKLLELKRASLYETLRQRGVEVYAHSTPTTSLRFDFFLFLFFFYLFILQLLCTLLALLL